MQNKKIRKKATKKNEGAWNKYVDSKHNKFKLTRFVALIAATLVSLKSSLSAVQFHIIQKEKGHL